MAIREPVRECLEKDPADRTPEDIDILLEFTQTFPAFFNMTLATRRALCAGKSITYRIKGHLTHMVATMEHPELVMMECVAHPCLCPFPLLTTSPSHNLRDASGVN